MDAPPKQQSSKKLLDAKNDETTHVEITQSEDNIEDNDYLKIFSCILLSSLWTLLMTAIPLLANVGPHNYYAKHKNWYSGDDVIRLLEPIGGTPLFFLVYYNSGIPRRDQSRGLSVR